MFVVFDTVNVYMCTDDLFHILLSLWHTYGSMEFMYIFMYVYVFSQFWIIHLTEDKMRTDMHIFWATILLTLKLLISYMNTTNVECCNFTT